MYGYKYIYYRNAANCITQVNFSTPQGGARMLIAAHLVYLH